MLRLFILLAGCLLASSYTIKPNPDAGDFNIFPVLSLGAAAVPTTLTFSDDGRTFIGQKNGVVHVVDADGNLEKEPWIDLSDIVNSAGDKGLSAVKLHPNFPTVPYVYMFYPLWQNDTRDLNRVTQGVLARYTEKDGKLDRSSEFLLIGKTNGTGTPSCHNSHVTGDVVFANDGTLFVSAGEGSHWDAVDDGTNFPFGFYDWQCALFFGSEVDVGSFRAQLKNNLGGKIMRIDPATGNGIGADNFPTLFPNPFYDPAHPDGFQSVIWTLGHRNPWKMRIAPGPSTEGPGTIYIAEAGAKDYEEINVVKPSQAGKNYGWPCQIANRRLQPWFTNTTLPTEYFVPVYPTNQNTIDTCNSMLPNLQDSVEPIFYYSRTINVYGEYIGVIGNCVSGMAFYNGTNYPDSYRPQADGTKTLFISDFGLKWIKVIRVDKNDKYLDSYGTQDFLDNVGSILEVKAHPQNGDIYFITQEGEVNRIRYTAGYIGAPIIDQIGASPQTVNIANGPATIQFSSDNTFDPANLALNFTWNFGDGTFSNEPNPKHTYSTAGTFKVELQVSNAAGYSATQSTTVSTNNDAPVIKVNGPNWFKFVDGEDVTVSASFSDKETPAENLQYFWEYRIVHNNHVHPSVITEPADGLGKGSSSTDTRTFSSIISQHERNMLEIYVTAMDSTGASSRAIVRAVPDYPGNANVDTNETPKAHFEHEQQGSVVFFNGGSTSDADVDFLNYSWNWGDGTTGTGQVSYHAYAQPGEYNVQLSVEDPWQATDSYSAKVIVVAPPTYVPTSLTVAPSTTAGDTPRQTTSVDENKASSASALAAGVISLVLFVFVM